VKSPKRLVRVPSDTGGARISFHTLAAELVGRNHVHLSWIAGAAIIAFISFALLARQLQPEVAAAQKLPLVRMSILMVVLASGALIGVERLGLLSPNGLLRFGLVYEVLVAAAISVLENAMPWAEDHLVRGASSITVWIIPFALLIPAPPLMAMIFSLLAAAMGPLGHYAISAILGLDPAPANRLWIYYAPCFLASAVSGLINLRILRLEGAAATAREMGSYELDSLLARGGMGEVWRARHRMLKREAAIKLIRTEALITQSGRDALSLRKRFEQEARAIASLKSPHTVAIYDFGVSEDGGFFYAMELLEGYDLEKLVKEHGPQPPGRVVHILRQACDSLDEAHRRAMVHRDVKPTNIFLCRLGTTFDFCKLLDFGLVKLILPDEDQTQMTVEGTAAGTPAFMSPEVALGERDIDARADVYGIGCVAYWLLTGCLVFEESSAYAMAAAHVQKTPAAPSQRTEMEIPEGLESVVLQCLAKKREDRPASAAILSKMLADCDGGLAWRAEDAERWWDAHPVVAPTRH